MEEDFVSFKTANLAKEKKFDKVDCRAYFHLNEGYSCGYAFCYSEVKEQSENVVLAPTKSFLQKWLREKHNIQVYAYSHTLKNGIWGDYVVYINNVALNDARDEEYQTCESALEFGLFEALKKINDYENKEI
jgi:hypothetical protein